MINKQRVQRIRSIIYLLIVLLVLVPIFLIIVLCFKMVGLMGELSAHLAQTPPGINQSVPMPDAGDDGYVIPAEPPREAAPGEEPLPGSDVAALLSPEGEWDGEYDLAPEDDLSDFLPPIEADGEEASGLEPKKQSAVPRNTDTQSTGEYVVNTYSPASHPSLRFDTLPVAAHTSSNVIYLTFDNTPSGQTQELLRVLDKHGVKGTFFVWCNRQMPEQSAAFWKQLAQGGHSIGIHCASSQDTLSQLYASADDFLENYQNIFHMIFQETGVKTRLYRFPGGSIHPSNPQRQQVLAQVKQELDARGFLQFDWNASGQDAATPPLSSQRILGNIKASMGRGGPCVVLLHDGTGSSSTAQALDDFIAEYTAAGYVFRTLDHNTPPVSFLEKK